MKRTCGISGQEFDLPERYLALLEKLNPVIGGVEYELPLPTLSPDERKRRRLAFRNERNLYRRKCDATGKTIISAYSPDKSIPVYSKEEWWSDRWDALQYGKEFDFTRSFFEQFAELQEQVPRMALTTDPRADENNCQYINFAGSSKNCYMTFDSDFNEDSSYSNVLKHSRNCLDCSYVIHSELCYESIDCSNCYSLFYSQDCSGCNDSYFLHNCIGCCNCVGCVNLVRKEFYIFNKKYSRSEYFEILESFALNSTEGRKSFKTKFKRILLGFPRKYAHILKSVNSSGDYITNSKNCGYSFNIGESEDLYYCDALYNSKDCVDVSSFGEKIERVYESGTIGVDCYNIYFAFTAVMNCSDLLYCDGCRQTKDSFGCCGLKREQYCILNKKYPRDEYYKLIPKIIGHMQKTGEWGEFFPIHFSAFGYNESMAQERYPLNREEAVSFGANWSDYCAPDPSVKVLSSDSIPGTISEVSDSILERAIKCPVTGKPFRITAVELEFYRKNDIPLPILHSDERHRLRMLERNPERLWERKCAITGEKLLSSYAPEREEQILCSEAFQEALD